MKLSRKESGLFLVKKLSKIGYFVSRQKGSHIRLTKSFEKEDHHLTIPNHNPIKIGLLSKILKDVAEKMELSVEELMKLINDK